MDLMKTPSGKNTKYKIQKYIYNIINTYNLQ